MSRVFDSESIVHICRYEFFGGVWVEQERHSFLTYDLLEQGVRCNSCDTLFDSAQYQVSCYKIYDA